MGFCDEPCSPDCPERRRVFRIPARMIAEFRDRLAVVLVGRTRNNHGQNWCLSIGVCSGSLVVKSECC